MHQPWDGARVLVTGGAGFVGQAVVAALQRRGVAEADIVVPRSRSCDLRQPSSARDAVRGCRIVIHLAAPTGGISYSREHPASQFRDCTLINLNLLEAARAEGVARVVALGNLLAYPASAPVPLVEAQVHDGPVSRGHLGIALAKRNLISLAEMYRDEFGLHMINVLAANAYGPGDHFDSPHSHVIPATIAKCFRDEDLIVWGDGTPTRDFLFVEDVAEGLLMAGERLDAGEFVNLASGREISIAELVRLIAALCGFRHRVVFDAEKGGPDFRRVASRDRAAARLGFVPRVSIEEGLRRTIEWYTRARMAPSH